MNIFVIRAAGYIGSICSEVLVELGMRVVALDSLLEGHRAPCRQGHLLSGRLANRTQIENVFSQHKIDAVMHFAGEALVAKSVRAQKLYIYFLTFQQCIFEST